MPRKDLIARKAYAAAQYAKNKAQHKERMRLRRMRIAAENKSLKAQAPAVSHGATPRACKSCGADITDSYKSKWGCACRLCHLAQQQRYRQQNKERIAACKKAWVIANKEHKAAQDRGYAHRNKIARSAARNKWRHANPEKDLAAKAKNRVARQRRTPVWLSEDDAWMIAQAYEVAVLRTRIFGFPWHVDHVLPLNGRRVSGLHVPTNLQVIPGAENIRKHNRETL